MPQVLDPALRFEVDSGVSIRRSRWSRPRRIFQVDYLGLTSQEMRHLRDFLMECRLTVIPFQWTHPTASDLATTTATTPVQLLYQHGLVSGQWVGIFSATWPALNGFWQITRLTPTSLSLNGSTSPGSVGTCGVFVYLPNAIGAMQNDTMEAPVKHMGPDSVRDSRGRWSASILVEEIF